MPEAFLERLKLIVPPEKYDEVVKTFYKRRPTTFRTNTLKTTTEKLIGELKAQGFKFEPVSWYKDAFILTSPTKKELIETDQYKNGELYVQTLSSMIAPLVLDPKPNEQICDLTAAPGSKTTQIAMLMENTGRILANDKSRVRLYKLQANLTMQGVANTTVANTLGQTLWKLYPEKFDKTLVDVPCTLEGRFFADDPKTYREWSTNKIKILSQYQKFLLRSAISLTKPGGTIVYSTCTFEPEENEAVVDWVLAKEKGNVVVEPIELTLSKTQPGLLKWKSSNFKNEIKNTMRILPTEVMEGFFVAKLKKLKSTIDSSEAYK